MKKAATPEEVTAPHKADTTRRPIVSQVERVTVALLWLGSLTCQEAEQYKIRARHLNSVMSELRHNKGISWIATPETVPGFQGEPTRLVRYQLTEQGKEQARQQVEGWRQKRGTTPMDWQQFAAMPLAALMAGR